MLKRLYYHIGKFFESGVFAGIVLLVGVIAVIMGKEAEGAILLLNLGGLVLLFCEHTLSAFFPALIACGFVIRCYDSASLFLPLWGGAVFPILAIFAHLILYRRRLTVGKSFWGILAVTVAVTLGGMFSISAADYFTPASLYYVLGLGAGMLAAYVLLRSHTYENDRFDIFERFANMMALLAVFCTFVVAEHYLSDFADIWAARKIPNIQWSNNISTLMMLAMPFTLYAARYHKIYLPIFFLVYAAIILTGSRGGWVFGTAEFILCLIFVHKIFEGQPARKWVTVSLGTLLMIGVAVGVVMMILYRDWHLVSRTESRVLLLGRAVEDFLSAPVFGKGLGCRDNTDLYNGKAGTIIWYHMMIPQIVGSMGMVGIVAYGYQLVGRLRLMLARITPYTVTLSLSYIGLFLMSQVNPGEFCPLPYELLAVVIFILLERYAERRE